MFEKIRKPGRGKSLASYVIFGLICLIFVFIGVPLDQSSSLGGSAMVVNNKVISWAEFQNYLESLQSQSKPAVDPDEEAKRQDRLRQQAIDSLLNMELMFQTTHHIGLMTAGQAIQESIVELPLFQEEGRFVHSRYRDFLKLRGFSASHFESLIQKDIQIRRLQDLFKKTIPVSQLEKERKNHLGRYKIQVSYLAFPSDTFKDGELSVLKEVVEEGKENELSQLMKDKAVEWKKVEPFDLRQTRLPGLSTEKKLFNTVIQNLPQLGLVKNLVKERNQTFILKIDRVDHIADNESEQSISSMESFMDQMMPQMVFYSWIRFARSSAKLQFNPSLKLSNSL